MAIAKRMFSIKVTENDLITTVIIEDSYFKTCIELSFVDYDVVSAVRTEEWRNYFRFVDIPVRHLQPFEGGSLDLFTDDLETSMLLYDGCECAPLLGYKVLAK